MGPIGSVVRAGRLLAGLVVTLGGCTASRVTSTVDALPAPSDDVRDAPRRVVVLPGRYAERVAGCIEGSGLFSDVRVGGAPEPGDWTATSELWLVTGGSGRYSPWAALLLFLLPTGGTTIGVVEIDVTSPVGERSTLTWDFEEERTLWLFAPLLRAMPGWSSPDGEQGDAFGRALRASGMLTAD